MYLFSHARTAFKYGLKTLNLNRGDELLLPSYLCEVLLHPINSLDLKYSFYDLNDQLQPDWNQLNSLLKKETKAILMIHTFGIPQDIEKFKKFSSENNIFLIEDNAHGFGGYYKDKKLGTFGDFSFSSPRKILEDLVSGGILEINNELLKIKAISLDYSSLEIYTSNPMRNKVLVSLRKIPNSEKYIRGIKKFLQSRPRYEDPNSFREEPLEDFLIDKRSKNILLKTDWSLLAKKRYINYFKWEKFLKNRSLKPVFNSIPEKVNPWCYPVYSNSKSESLYWFKWGWEKNYTVFSWPTLPKDLMNNYETLRRWENLICFSTNQSPKK